MHSVIAYNKVLNAAQYAAATAGRGPLLVIAGAGSGKTRTLTYRVARLVEDGVPPESILLLSFTRKASQEMLNPSAGSALPKGRGWNLPLFCKHGAQTVCP